MNCVQHPDRPATAFCRTCGNSLCAEDQREIYGVIYCQSCLARQMGQAAPGAAPASLPGATYLPPPGAPSPALALLLGFIPGVGAIYNGQYFKAFVQVVVFGFLIAMANSGEMAPLVGIAIAAFYLYMLIDSYRTAKALSLGQPVHDVLGGSARLPMDAPVAAVILIAIGIVFLLHSLGWFTYHLSRFLWPLVLIAIGVYLLQRKNGASQ